MDHASGPWNHVFDACEPRRERDERQRELGGVGGVNDQFRRVFGINRPPKTPKQDMEPRRPYLTPYELGYLAAVYASYRIECPFPAGTLQFQSWIMGFSDACDDGLEVFSKGIRHDIRNIPWRRKKT